MMSISAHISRWPVRSQQVTRDHIHHAQMLGHRLYGDISPAPSVDPLLACAVHASGSVMHTQNVA